MMKDGNARIRPSVRSVRVGWKEVANGREGEEVKRPLRWGLSSSMECVEVERWSSARSGVRDVAIFLSAVKELQLLLFEQEFMNRCNLAIKIFR